MQRSVSRLPGLEALRLVAAASVLLLHAGAVFGGHPAFARGYLGVDYFLMLSGLLMALVQEPRFRADLNPWRHIARRYARLWPLVALGGLIGLPMEWLRTGGGAGFWWASGLNLALLPAWGQRFAFPLNIPAWTIFAELVVGATYILALRRLGTRWLLLVLVGLGAIMLWIAQGPASLNVGPRPANLAQGLIRCLFAFLLGLVLGRRWRIAPPPPVPAALALVAMPATLVGLWWLKVTGWWVDPLLVVTLCPLMLAGGMRLTRFGAAAGLAGRLGFPLFAWQMPILEGLRHLHCGYWLGLSVAVAGGVLGALVETQLARRRARM